MKKWKESGGKGQKKRISVCEEMGGKCLGNQRQIF